MILGLPIQTTYISLYPENVMSTLPLAPDFDLCTAITCLEQRITDLSLAVDRQNVQIGEILDLLGDLRNRTDWSAAQVGELLRILFTSIQQVRDTQIGSLLAEGPITVATLQQLQATSIAQAQDLIATKRTCPSGMHKHG